MYSIIFYLDRERQTREVQQFLADHDTYSSLDVNDDVQVSCFRNESGDTLDRVTLSGEWMQAWLLDPLHAGDPFPLRVYQAMGYTNTHIVTLGQPFPLWVYKLEDGQTIYHTCPLDQSMSRIALNVR